MFDYVYYIIKQCVSSSSMLFVAVFSLCFSPERLIIRVAEFRISRVYSQRWS